ncbi:MAG TPA: hypothetical protein VNQ80_15430 [Parapedobacter sp.]|uniref:hypothetical protein n=1 Tax=Parapedobacter sp. TaxID=1958893 RepID=UPI002CE15CC9|nr:hypothetical protein [Parapedobacter sp.]HWK58734.1 hypothetical protein [Parapedobacter sp.]
MAKNNGVEFVTDDLALIAGGEILVEMGTPVNLDPLKKQPVSPKKKQQSSEEIARWGEDNDFPQLIIEANERSTELPSLLDWMARALQGREVLPFIKKWNPETRKLEYEYVEDEEITNFLSDIAFKRYMREAPTDFFWFWNVFPELIKAKGGDKIAYLGTQDASFCRWGKQNNKGIVDKCYINANWPDARPDDKETVKLPVIDPYSNERIDLVRKSQATTFIYPVSYPSPGKVYYQLAKWNGYLVSGWESVARKIPKSKENQMKRVFSALYKLSIPIAYWPATYKDWDKLSPQEQKEKKQEKLAHINKTLTGEENAGKTILTEFGKDRAGNDLPEWKIEKIERHELSGEHLEDSREASEHLMRALGVDPTLVGDGPGKKMGGGSGSDKRVAFNIYVALQQPYRDVILEPLDFIAEYNGWKAKHPGLCFRMVEIELETLDKSHKTAKETTN